VVQEIERFSRWLLNQGSGSATKSLSRTTHVQ
jgi:hypothetical protein